MKRSLTILVFIIAIVIGAGAWYLHSKQPKRDGEISLNHLQAPVSVRYDERGVPHIQAGNEADLYRALGYVQAQDRLFQMEMIRRLARGELAEVLGPKLVATDKLFRSLRIREHADAYVAAKTPQPGKPCKPISMASTSFRTRTPSRWSSICWASPNAPSPQKIP
jgi:penicillin amidase